MKIIHHFLFHVYDIFLFALKAMIVSSVLTETLSVDISSGVLSSSLCELLRLTAKQGGKVTQPPPKGTPANTACSLFQLSHVYQWPVRNCTETGVYFPEFKEISLVLIEWKK